LEEAGREVLYDTGRELETRLCGDVGLCVMEKREKETAFVPGTDVLQRDGTARMRIARFWFCDR
jgi:hypothetical protein